VSAVIDVDAGTIFAEIEIEAPRERVFTALTDPGELAAWWGSADTYRTFDWQLDVRPGGEWSCKAKSAQGDSLSSVHGRYLVVEPPRLLVYTWHPSWDGFAASTVRCELESVESGTRVRVKHSGFEGRPESCREHGKGWETVFGWLRDGVAASPAPR
jgi:uncharacterized protein YndB with AHSA1/START domain